MTHKAFWDAPYRTELATTITAVNGDVVQVAATIFYAESGGQESDAGQFNQWPVLAARKDGKAIHYTLPAGHDLQPGDAVTMQIDWPRRHALMRLHFAAEIVLELVCAALPGVVKVGAHIAADKARIDFLLDTPVTPLLPALTEQANAIVIADYAIESAFSDEAGERRYWQIPALARVPCGGTHLRHTGEIGSIALKRKNVGKGKERIEITVAA
ncbi:Ser-tRNA(Ala) deacylase AlaX (editing enzyme) [Andreprevotia lacus DSM 23236]|jgi:Ser-tRNA(Ala) deacylase AlaX|uniref:Ser-tRNA(Ala) deacylase AlaX (Editing enzyme) n=1 Tax=Andreprevotia lacus DSM 23236 TaxID=1121001 RepID=A0A1W1Y0C7_9NEIS|nr:alanyl-tRNA editing protein [Andreprevotia lacus]SMC29241.1 Ser-tRNA(Ala) deacylase AlaX (editing enzyme) [Andreprevotia lacus DSM 23236]